MIKQLVVPIALLALATGPAASKEFSVVCQFTETHWEEAFGRKAAWHPDPKDEFVFTYAASDTSNDDEVIAGTYQKSETRLSCLPAPAGYWVTTPAARPG